MKRAALVPLSVVLFASCSPRASSAPPAPTAPATPVWNKLLVPSADLAGDAVKSRGWRIARAVVHFHSPYSHDACDNWWHLDDGGTRAPGDVDDAWRTCEAQMRDAICAVEDDVVLITDHPSFIADFSIEQLLHIAPGDEPIVENGVTVANRLGCANGRRPTIAAGMESNYMALALREHVPGTAEERRATYASDDALPAFHAAGGLAAAAHTEQRPLADLESRPIDAMEVYNLHANIDPKIRQNFLGLDPYTAAAETLKFVGNADDTPEPDLAFMAFLAPNDNALAKWDALLAQKDVPGVAGTDVHQNTLPGDMKDGERGDSYRRLLRWISNDVLVRSPDLASVKEALAAGRLYTAFDVFGSPQGFDFSARSDGGTTEMGGHAKLGVKLVYARPTPAGVALAPPPVVHARLVRSTASGAVEVASSDGDIAFVPTEPGAYRVEVSIEPRHVLPYMGRLASEYAGRVYPWIYSNAIHVDPAP